MPRHWSESAEWIWTPTWDERHQVARIVQFRKKIALESIPSKFIVNVSADSRYRLFVNGRSASFGPAKSHLGEWNYETVDITPLFRKGENVIAAQVLRYSAIHSGNMSVVRAVIPGFILYSEDLVRNSVIFILGSTGVG